EIVAEAEAAIELVQARGAKAIISGGARIDLITQFFSNAGTARGNGAIARRRQRCRRHSSGNRAALDNMRVGIFPIIDAAAEREQPVLHAAGAFEIDALDNA